MSKKTSESESLLGSSSHNKKVKEEEESEVKKVTMKSICDGSPNVGRVFLYNCLDGVAFSVWNVSVVQLLIYRVAGNSNTAVGWVSGVTGASQVLAAIVGSYFADKGKREAITQSGSFCGFLGVIITMLAAYFEILALFYASGVCWGYYMGFSYPASEALFADSVASGQRTAIYSYKWALGTVSYVFGYSINMILFLAIGNHWADSTIKIVVFCGLALNPLSLLTLLTVRDKYSLGKESEGLLQGGGAKAVKNMEKKAEENRKGEEEGAITVTVADDKVVGDSSKSNAEVEGSGEKDGDSGKGESKEDGDGTNKDIDWSQSFLCFKTKHVPFMLATADFVSSLGAGMTMRFFPLFFINIYDVPPALLNLGYVLTMILVALIATGIQRLAKTRVGRVPSMMLVRIGGAGCLYYMAVATDKEGDALMGVMIAVWIVRTSLMNSPTGLSRSVIMDHVPKSQRTRWNAVESLNGFTWAGSAVVGGYLVDGHGYKFTFAITATFQLMGALIISPAAPLTRKIDLAAAEKKQKEDAEKGK